MLKNVAHKNNKKREALPIKNNKKREVALKNEAGGDEKHFFFSWLKYLELKWYGSIRSFPLRGIVQFHLYETFLGKFASNGKRSWVQTIFLILH